MNDLKIKKLKKIFDKDYSLKTIDSFVMRYFSEFNASGIRKDLVFEWADEKTSKMCDEFLTTFNQNILTIDPFIDNDKTLSSLLLITQLNYLPSKLVCEKIILAIEKSKTLLIENYKDFCPDETNLSVWDLFLKFNDFVKDPHSRYNFQCTFLNDNKYFNPGPYYFGHHTPYETGKRFSGFLAHLFYSGYFDLYERMFNVLLDSIQKDFNSCLPLQYFLYAFCKKYDEDKALIILELIKKMKSKTDFFNNKLKLFECYKNLRTKDYPDSIFLTLDEILK